MTSPSVQAIYIKLCTLYATPSIGAKRIITSSAMFATVLVIFAVTSAKESWTEARIRKPVARTSPTVPAGRI